MEIPEPIPTSVGMFTLLHGADTYSRPGPGPGRGRDGAGFMSLVAQSPGLEGPHAQFCCHHLEIPNFEQGGPTFSFSTGPSILCSPTNWVGRGRKSQGDRQIGPEWRRYKVEGMTNCPKVGGMLKIVTFI